MEYEYEYEYEYMYSAVRQNYLLLEMDGQEYL
jgi:hypothetical protein